MVRTSGLLSFVAAMSLSVSALAEDAAPPEGGGGLGLSGTAAPAAPDAPVVHTDSSGGPAVVTVESAGKQVTVSQIVSRIAATGVGAGGTVTVVGGTYRDLCMTPCTFEVKPGLYELGIHGSGVSGMSQQFELRSGPQKIRANPGSSGVAFGGYALTVLGGTALIVGVVFIFVADDIMDFPALPLTLIGAGTTGLGIGMMVAGSSSMDKVGQNRPPTGLASHRPAGVTLRGNF